MHDSLHDYTTGAWKSDPNSGELRVTIRDMVGLAVSEGIDHLKKPAIIQSVWSNAAVSSGHCREPKEID